MDVLKIVEYVMFFVKLFFDWRADARKDKMDYLKKIRDKFRKKSAADDLSERGYAEEERLKKKWEKIKGGKDGSS